MTFTEWYQLQSIDIREDLDVWSAQQGWNAAINQLRLDLEALDLLRKMSPLPQHTEKKSK